MSEIHMPDFEHRLELALTHEMRRRRRAAGAVRLGGIVACAVVGAWAALSAGNGGDLAPPMASARPYPAIIYRDAAVQTPSDEEVGVVGAQVHRARAFDVGGHTGYVVPNAEGAWCISVPDLATANPDIERGTTCAPSTRDLKRFGLSVAVGSVVAAAIPAGAPAPVRSYGGSRREVPVDERGIAVVTDLRPSERFIVQGQDGGHRTHTAPRDIAKQRFMCPDGTVVQRSRDC